MYYQSDYILRLIEDAAKFLGKVLHTYQESEIEKLVDEDGVIDELTFFEYRLNRLFYAGKYCEAENLLFHALEQQDGNRYLNVAVSFYQRLCSVETEKLIADGYSEERIVAGLKRLRAMFPVNDSENE